MKTTLTPINAICYDKNNNEIYRFEPTETNFKLVKDCTLHDCKELKQLIIENPELPLITFVSEEAWGEESYYTQCTNVRASIEELTLYKETWFDEECYEEELANDCADMEEFNKLTDNEFEQMIQNKIKETNFVKAICMYVG